MQMKLRPCGENHVIYSEGYVTGCEGRAVCWGGDVGVRYGRLGIRGMPRVVVSDFA